MERRTGIEGVRQRPGMYIGGTGEEGVLHLVLEVIGNAFDAYLRDACTSIAIEIDAEDTVTVRDDGPGMPIDGGEGLPPLEVLLTTLSIRPTVDGHRPHVHLADVGVGLAVVHALSDRFELTTVRGGVATTFTGARGVITEPRRTTPTGERGTTVRFRPDPTIFRTTRASRVALSRRLEELSFLSPGLALRWSFTGDASARRGLAGAVELAAERGPADVAHARARHGTDARPIDVEVALAWRTGHRAGAQPAIDSFANYARTVDHGSHIQGLHIGIRRFFGGGTLEQREAGLVAAIAVVLPDVIFGGPSKSKLVDAAVVEPVAAEVHRALQAWAEAHPDEAAALRARAARRARRS